MDRFIRKAAAVEAAQYHRGDTVPGVEDIPCDGEAASVLTKAGRVGIREGDWIVNSSGALMVYRNEDFGSIFAPEPVPTRDDLMKANLDLTDEVQKWKLTADKENQRADQAEAELALAVERAAAAEEKLAVIEKEAAPDKGK